MKRVLVTGAAGFLGSHLCDRFIKEGCHVIGMDNLITGNMDNLSHLMPLPEFEFHHHDVTKYVHIPGQLDYIMHFASPASPIDYLKIPIQTLKVGAMGTHNLLGVAKAKKARILVASTSEVYGDPLVHPQTEDYWGNVNPIGPRGVYDEAKRYMEAITMAYHTFHGVETRIVRIFNTYGPRMRLNDGRALPTFFRQAMEGEDITVFGDGSQTRSFCYVDDLVEGIYRLLLSDCHMPVNIGNPVEITIKQLAEEVLQMTASSSKVIYKDLPKDDPKVRQPNITKAKEILNWSPKFDRAKGMALTYEYFKEKIAKGLVDPVGYEMEQTTVRKPASTTMTMSKTTVVSPPSSNNGHFSGSTKTQGISDTLNVDQLLAKFTPNRPSNAKGSLSHKQVKFLYEQVLAKKPKVAAELGVASGVSSAIILYGLQTLKKHKLGSANTQLHSFDIMQKCYWSDDLDVGYVVNLMIPEEAQNYILHIPYTSVDLGKFHLPNSIDFLFIDANHRHPWPSIDLLCALPYLTPDALVCLHDINLPLMNNNFTTYGVQCLFNAVELEKFISTEDIPNIGSIQLDGNHKKLESTLIDLIKNKKWEANVDPKTKQHLLDVFGLDI